MAMRQISLIDLKSKLIRFLKGYFSDAAAEGSAEVIIWAELHDKKDQGLLKLLGTEPLQNVKPDGDMKVTDRSPVSSIIEANRQPSFHVARAATDIAIEKALKHGFSVVGANGIFSSTGALGYYVERMARSGLIGMAMARSPGAMAPFDSMTPLFGTNPLAIAFPTEEDPIVFDMATSAITWYELVLAKMRGESIPPDVAIDREGKMTRDPEQAMEGALLPFDKSYKGSGLGMVVELMSGPLVGSAYCDYQTFDKDWGFFALCFRPDLLVDLDEFRHHASELRRIVKSQPCLNGEKPLRFPGDVGNAFAAEILKRGYLEIEEEAAILLDG